jgi:hypothetical protein
VFPAFEDYNARIKKPGGFRLRNAASEREWLTPSKKAQFLVFSGLYEDGPDRDRADADHTAQPRPVQHHDLRHERPLSRHHRAARRGVRQRQDGNEVIVDGDLRMNRINGCNSRNGKVTVRVRGVGEIAYDNFPQIAVRVPMNAKISAGGAVFGDIGRSDSVDLSNAGCGDWTIANTKGALKVSQAGSGDTKTGVASSAEISIAGSGDVTTQAIGGNFEANIAGSGDVSAASIAGRLEGNIAGSGNITVAGGRSRSVEVNVMGSGDVTFNGEADEVEVSVAGSGDVKIAKVNGAVRKHVAGSGDVIIGGR